MDKSRTELFREIRVDMSEVEGIVREIRKTEKLLRDLKQTSRAGPTVVMDGTELSHDMAKLAKALMIRELSGRLEGLYQNYIKTRNSQKFYSVSDVDVESLRVDEFI
jgi:uncharacterized membrane-anchored protein